MRRFHPSTVKNIEKNLDKSRPQIHIEKRKMAVGPLKGGLAVFPEGVLVRGRVMSKVIDADNMRYTKRHEWVLLEDDVATVGLTDYAQLEVPEINFVEMPSEETELTAGEEAATVESPGDSLSVMAPVDGTVVEVNTLLEDNPELVNADPYGDGWIFRLEMTNLAAWRDLLTAEEYEEYLGE